MARAMKRSESLKQVLEAHRREAEEAVYKNVRHERADKSTRAGDTLEHTDASTENEISFTLLQMRAEKLRRVNEALARLDAGHYGSCIDCEADIAESRLRALPFAVRCRDCAERHERNPVRPSLSGGPAADRPWPFAPVVGP